VTTLEEEELERGVRMTATRRSTCRPVAEARRRLIQPARPAHQILDRARRQHAAVGVERVDAEIFRPADHAALAQALDHVSIPTAADIGVAGHAADRLLALNGVAAQQQVRDAFLRDDVRDVIAIDHDRRQLEVQLLGQRDRIELFDEKRHVLISKGLADLHDELAASA